MTHLLPAPLARPGPVPVYSPLKPAPGGQPIQLVEGVARQPALEPGVIFRHTSPDAEDSKVVWHAS